MRGTVTYLLTVILLAACTHEPVIIEKNVVNACDTINPSYKNDILPIFKVNCYECHSTAVIDSANEGGFDIENFASLKQYLKEDFKHDGIYGSMFIHCIEHAQFAKKMPPNSKLDTCSTAKIKSWIRDGANNN